MNSPVQWHILSHYTLMHYLLANTFVPIRWKYVEKLYETENHQDDLAIKDEADISEDTKKDSYFKGRS